MSWVYLGLLPARFANDDNVALSKHPVVNVSGDTVPIVSVVGVKWTTARRVGEEACRQLASARGVRYQRPVEDVPLRAIDISQASEPSASTVADRSREPDHAAKCVIRTDNSAEICSHASLDLALVRDHCRSAGAYELTSMLASRTDLCTETWLTPVDVEKVAAAMAAELGWSAARRVEQYRAAIEFLADRVPWQDKWRAEKVKLERSDNV